MREGTTPAGSPPATGAARERSSRSQADGQEEETGRERGNGEDQRPEAARAVPLLEPRDGLPPLVATASAFAEAVAMLGMGGGPVAVDAERASGYRYGHRAFLVQFRRRGSGTVLIDPVACPDLSALDAVLAPCEAVLHAASQDLPCLAELGYQPRQLFDTELAGRLLGYPRVGLGALVEAVLGFTLEKGHAAADWSTRPLPTEWLRYAALDVEVLVELRDALAAELAEQGKTEWARQEFAAVLVAGPPPPRPDPWRRTSGIHRVHTRRGMAVVRELWLERDRIARRRDLSPGRVLPDSAIVEAARALPGSQRDLTELPGFKGRGARRHAPEWRRAVDRARAQAEPNLPGTASPPPEGPPPAHRWAERDPVAARRLAAVRTAVAALADAHSLPAENLLQPEVVRRLAWRPPEPPTPEAVEADLMGHGARPWQAELTANPISKALIRLIEQGDD
jgi:ribonuclease D